MVGKTGISLTYNIVNQGAAISAAPMLHISGRTGTGALPFYSA